MSAIDPIAMLRPKRKITGMSAVLLPFTVGGTDGAKNLFGLYDDTINRLLAAIKD